YVNFFEKSIVFQSQKMNTKCSKKTNNQLKDRIDTNCILQNFIVKNFCNSKKRPSKTRHPLIYCFVLVWSQDKKLQKKSFFTAKKKQTTSISNRQRIENKSKDEKSAANWSSFH
ncbi:hypothetical protein RFI_01696, partial [Reticulomyxa filosa]